MMQQSKKDLREWVDFLGNAEIPILKQTQRDLLALRDAGEKSSAHEIAIIIARDPLMTTRLLRYLQLHKRRSQTNEVLEVEQALLMMGIDPFFKNVLPELSVEEILHSRTPALIAALRVVHRAHRSSSYAFDWAVRLRDMHFEEVRIAALLRDLAEILMWCYSPEEMLEIKRIQDQDKSLRSGAVQESVIGFRLVNLQKELVKEWNLPALLLKLMDADNAQSPRVCNVVLADRLARHSSHGWDDAALPDDYKDIADLLKVSADDVKLIVGVEEPAK